MIVKPKSEVWVNGVCYVAGQDAPITESASDIEPKKENAKKKLRKDLETLDNDGKLDFLKKDGE